MRVRVEAFSKISATDLPSSGRGVCPRLRPGFEAIGRVEQPDQAFGSEVAELEQMPHQDSARTRSTIATPSSSSARADDQRRGKAQPLAAGLGQEQAIFAQFAQELPRVDPIFEDQRLEQAATPNSDCTRAGDGQPAARALAPAVHPSPPPTRSVSPARACPARREPQPKPADCRRRSSRGCPEGARRADAPCTT